MIDSIVQQVLNKIQVPSTSNFKLGRGATDLIATLPETTSDTESDTASVTSTSPTLDNTSTSLNALDEQLLKSVISKHKKNAKSLLEKIKNYPEAFSYSSDGLISINGNPLENSNIFQLFPKLYKPTKYESEPHLKQVVNELATLGLGYLIARHYTRGLSPGGKNLIKDRHIIRKVINSQSPWYYIGDD